MVVVLDVFDDSAGDWKIPSDLAVKKVLLTVLVPAVQQNIQNVLLFVPLIVILRVRTPYPIEITVAEKVHQSPVLTPAVIHVFFSTWLARNMIETLRQNQRQEAPMR